MYVKYLHIHKVFDHFTFRKTYRVRIIPYVIYGTGVYIEPMRMLAKTQKIDAFLPEVILNRLKLVCPSVHLSRLLSCIQSIDCNFWDIWIKLGTSICFDATSNVIKNVSDRTTFSAISFTLACYFEESLYKRLY